MLQTDENLPAVKSFLNRAQKAVSEGDVAAGAGIDIGSARRNLYGLMRTHHAALFPHDDGMLVYDFGKKLKPLNQPSWRDRLSSVARWTWRGFSFVYKASLAVVLVSYAVLFLVLIFAAAIAASVASEDEGPVQGAGYLVISVFRAIFDFSIMSSMVTATDPHGYSYRELDSKKSSFSRDKSKTPKKSFISSVYDFVLGPARAIPDENAQHREVSAFVRSNHGVLTIANVQALSGFSRVKAESFFALYVAQLDGEVTVTDEGVLYAEFPELLSSKSTTDDEEVVFFWDEYEAPFKLTGNTGGKNVFIGFLAAFNLFCATVILQNATLFGAAGLWLGGIPAAIFSLFFALVLFRAPGVWWKNRKRHQTNLKKRFFKAIFQARKRDPSFEELVDQANALATTERTLELVKNERLIEEMAVDFSVDIDANEAGQSVLQLDSLQNELQSAQVSHRR
ncbi:MAG: hypothetical protein GY822_26820 [Deltaproteobacteria bacterium]|nr:hypothetical protein [Deltaproteobacteria bacterium]